MKKITIIAAIIIVCLCLFKSETIVIPKEAIRFRVIANSNSKKDQNIKQTIVKKLSQNIQNLTLKPKDIITSRKNIKDSIPSFKKAIDDTLQDLKEETDYTIEYGMNYFPEKEYNGIIYEEGEYESLVIKLGKGNGDNFWCILFPPLCLLDGEETENKKIEYTSYIKEIIDKYF